MKYNFTISEQDKVKARSVLKSADLDVADDTNVEALSILFAEKAKLLEPLQPLAANYESVLAEKLWARLEAEKAPAKTKKRFLVAAWLGSFHQSFVRPALVSFSLLLVTGLVVWTLVRNNQLSTQSSDKGALALAIQDSRTQGATDEELDRWLASVSDTDTRYILTSQDLSGLSRGIDLVNNDRDYESIIQDVKVALGAKL